MPLFGLHKHNRSKQALNDPSVNPALRASLQAEQEQEQLQQQQQQQPSPQPQPPPPQPNPYPQRPQDAPPPQPRYVHSEPPSPHPSSASHFEAPPLERASLAQTSETSPPYSAKRYSSIYLTNNNSSVDELDREIQEHQAAKRHSANITTPVGDPKQKKGRGLLGRLKGSGRHQPEQQRAATAASHHEQQHTPRTRLVRRLSKRSENQHPPSTVRTVPHRDLQDQYEWQGAQGEASQLESPSEALEDDNDHSIDPYLIRDPETQQIRVNPNAPVQRPSTEVNERASYVEEESDTGTQEDYPTDAPSDRDHTDHLSPQPPVSTTSPTVLDHAAAGAQVDTDTSSEYSHESSVEAEKHEDRHRSPSEHSSAISPADTLSSKREEFPSRTSSFQPPKPVVLTTIMAPGASQQTRRNDMKQSPAGAQANNTSTPSLQAGVQASNQAPNYSRGGSGSGHQHVGSEGRASEQGRSTPPPAPSERDIGEAYKELSQKYKKVKGLYFDKTAQVEQLQNTLANQRMSQSRTSLDDNEYMTRFQRLDGAITNLAFNIRKDWKAIPSWIAQCVNADASRIGRQEMTAVGRACISRFLIDEIFSRCFHPGLDPELSANLKAIEINIRRFSPMSNSQEESDVLTTKVVQWRLTTLDGLRDALNSLEAEECKKQFALRSTSNLTAHLINCLVEPTPPGVEDSAHMIIELAVSIAANLPLESRDISIIYPMPGDILQPFIMKVETGLPPLDNPGLLGDTGSDHDGSSVHSGDRDDHKDPTDKDPKRGKEKSKGAGMLAAMMGQGGSNGGSKKGGLPSPGLEPEKKSMNDVGSGIVRFAGFVGVEVRGRQVLVKSPVWTVT